VASFTSRLLLRKPAGGDNVNVVTDLNDNYDKIDSNIGLFVCLSSSRPGVPFTGQQIYETDTKRRYVWTGSKWLLTHPIMVWKTAAESVTSSTAMQADNHIQFTLDAGVWLIEAWIHAAGHASGDFKMDWDFSGTITTSSRSTLGPAGSGGDTENTQVTMTAISSTADQQYALDTDTTAFIYESVFFDLANAGLLRMFWAQNVSNATATTLSSFGTRARATMIE
jgi:hypothetical protein